MADPIYVTDVAELDEISRAVHSPSSDYRAERFVWDTSQSEDKPAFNLPLRLILALVENRHDENAPDYVAISVGVGDEVPTLTVRRYQPGVENDGTARTDYENMLTSLRQFVTNANRIFSNPKSLPAEPSKHETQVLPEKPAPPAVPILDVFTGRELPPAPEVEVPVVPAAPDAPELPGITPELPGEE